MSDRLHVATRKGLFHVRRGPLGWSVHSADFLGKAVTATLFDPRDSAEYAAIDEGHFGCHLHRRLAGEAGWTEVAAPAFPAGATLVDRMPTDPVVDPSTAPRKPAVLAEVWSLEAGGADEPGVLWCGTIPGGLFRSHDRGDSWRLVESLWERPERDQWFGGGKDDPGVHSIAVDPRDARRVTVAVSCGGVWRTADGGATWSIHKGGMRNEYAPPDQAYDPATQDPHRLVGAHADPDRMWVQHHNGVFRSDDGGVNWTELDSVQPSVFGFAVAAHPRDRDTAWFVPAVKDERRYAVDAALAVSKTTDGGRTFRAVREGLPQRHAYDLVFRHALDVDAQGNRLAFGSTTGGLWVSEDAGESWAAIDARLPPVYAVRFA
ncbi:MAG: WD40/YVTN/BNR-like repeat-containing protein [Lacipirellulaceae bacterium]